MSTLPSDPRPSFRVADLAKASGRRPEAAPSSAAQTHTGAADDYPTIARWLSQDGRERGSAEACVREAGADIACARAGLDTALRVLGELSTGGGRR